MKKLQNSELDRRALVKGAAWSAPVLAAAIATPLAAATTKQAKLDLNAGCVQIAGLQLLPGFSVNNVGDADYTGSVTVVETIDLSNITSPFGDILGSTVRAALWLILLTEGVLSGASAGVTKGSWQSGGGLVPKVYTRTVTISGGVNAGGNKSWGTLFDLGSILNVLESFGLSAIKRSARITSPTGNPPVVDAGPSDLSYSLIGGC